MEKPHRITYRFNSIGEKIDESNEVVSEVVSEPETEVKFENERKFNEHMDLEQLVQLEQLEQLIRNSEFSRSDVDQGKNETLQEEISCLEAADASDVVETNEQVMNWDGAVYGDRVIEDEKNTDNPATSFTWLQGTTSVVGAIISGTLIGYLLLTLVFGISAWPLSGLAQSEVQRLAAAISNSDEELKFGNEENGQGRNDNTGQGRNDNTGQGTSDNAGQTNHSAVVGISLSEKSFQYYVLQAGVFTQQKTRDEVIVSLQQSGFPAHYIVDSSDRYFVYAGIATSPEDADSMKAKMKGIETYRKSLSFSLPSAMAFNGEAEQLERFVGGSNELIAMYADLIATQLEQSSLSPIGDAAMASWIDRVKDWERLADETSGHWTTTSDLERALLLKEQLLVAQQQLISYQEKPKASYLWEAQEALVKSVLLQKDWFESVNSLS